MLKSGTKLLAAVATLLAISFLWAGGCRRLTGHSEISAIEELLDANRLEAAAEAIAQYNTAHPADATGQQLTFLLALKQEHLDTAGTLLATLPDSTAFVGSLLSRHDPVLRANAARLISEHSLPVGLPVLLTGLNDSLPTVRGYCAETIGHRHDPSTVKPLFRLLSDDNWYVRAKAAVALAAIGEPRAAGWLLQLVGEGDPTIQLPIILALRQLAGESNQALLQRAYHVARPQKQFAIALALAKLSDPLVLGTLTNAVTAPDVLTRRLVAGVLGDYRADVTKEYLQRLAMDEDADVRQEARQALRRWKL